MTNPNMLPRIDMPVPELTYQQTVYTGIRVYRQIENLDSVQEIQDQLTHDFGDRVQQIAHETESSLSVPVVNRIESAVNIRRFKSLKNTDTHTVFFDLEKPLRSRQSSVGAVATRFYIYNYVDRASGEKHQTLSLDLTDNENLRKDRIITVGSINRSLGCRANWRRFTPMTRIDIASILDPEIIPRLKSYSFQPVETALGGLQASRRRTHKPTITIGGRKN